MSENAGNFGPGGDAQEMPGQGSGKCLCMRYSNVTERVKLRHHKKKNSTATEGACFLPLLVQYLSRQDPAGHGEPQPRSLPSAGIFLQPFQLLQPVPHLAAHKSHVVSESSCSTEYQVTKPRLLIKCNREGKFTSPGKTKNTR
jgi:hypothetical protein